jgi:hypothetical protein
MALSKKGIDVRETVTHLMFRALLQDSTGALVTSGTTNLYLYEIQSDGTLKSYDWSDNTFKTTALTTETQALTHRTGNNAGTNTGIWTYALTTLTGFTVGGIYLARAKNTSASPTDQVREFQFGSAEGDLLVTSTFFLKADLTEWLGVAPLALSSQQVQAIVPDTQKVDLNTVKTQTVTCAAGVTVGAFVGNGTAALAVDGSGRVDLGKWIGTAPLALSSQQVQAIVPDTQKVDLNTVKTQTVTCAAGVTVGAFVGNGTHVLVVDASGFVTAATNNDKTGYALSSAGLDQISAADPGAPASMTTFPKKLMGLWRWFFKKTDLNKTTGELHLYADDGTTVNATAAVSDDGTTQTKGALS